MGRYRRRYYGQREVGDIYLWREGDMERGRCVGEGYIYGDKEIWREGGLMYAHYFCYI